LWKNIPSWGVNKTGLLHTGEGKTRGHTPPKRAPPAWKQTCAISKEKKYGGNNTWKRIQPMQMLSPQPPERYRTRPGVTRQSEAEANPSTSGGGNTKKSDVISGKKN